MKSVAAAWDRCLPGSDTFSITAGLDFRIPLKIRKKVGNSVYVPELPTFFVSREDKKMVAATLDCLTPAFSENRDSLPESGRRLEGATR